MNKQEGEDLLQMQLTVNEDELRAADEVADEENKSVIKSIVDPAPGLAVNDEIDFKDIDFLPETTGNTYKLTPKVQKHLDEMILDSIQPKNEENIYMIPTCFKVMMKPLIIKEKLKWKKIK